MAKLTSELIVRLIDGVTGPAGKAAAGLKKIGTAARETSGRVAGGVVATQKSLQQGAERARMGMVDAVAQAYILKNALTAPISAAMELESSMADINKVVDFPTSDGLAKMKDDLREMSLRIPKTANDLAALAANAAQSGVELPDLMKFTEMTAKVAVAWNMTGDQAGESLAKLKTQLSMTVAETSLYADTINQLSNAMASEAPDLVDYAKRVAAVGKGFGFSTKETLAIGSAMISAGAEAEVAATSFRNMGKALSQGANAPKARRAGFKAIGLNPTKTAKKFQQESVETFRDVIQRIGKLPEWQQMSVASQIFGDEARGLMPLIKNLKLLDDALGFVADESKTAGSAQREFEARSKTAQNDMILFGNEMRDMAVTLGDALIPALKKTTDMLVPIVRAVKDWIAANPELAATLTKVAVGLVALRLASFGTAWMFGGIASSALTAAINIGKFGAASAAVAFAPLVAGLTNVRGAFQTMALRRSLAMKELGKSPGILASVGDGFLVFGRMLMRAVAPVRILKGGLTLLRGVLIGSGIGLAIAGIAMAGQWIWNNWEGLGEMFSGFADAFTKGIQPLMPILQPMVDAVGKLFDWIGGLTGPLAANNAEWKSWGETIGGSVAAGVMAVANGIERIIGLFASAIEKAKAFGSAVSNFMNPGGGPVPMYGGNSPIGDYTHAPKPAPGPRTDGVPTGRSVGGRVRAGQSYRVGESGVERFTPDIGGYVTSNKNLRGGVGAGGMGGGGGITYAPSFPISVTGATAADVAEAVRKAARQAQAEFAALMNGNFADGTA